MIEGVGFALRGFGLIFRPGVKRFLVLPFLVNGAVFSALLWYGIGLRDRLQAGMQDWTPDWLEGLFAGLLWVLFAFAGLGVGFFVFVLAANILAAPFNALIAGAVAKHLTGDEPPSSSIWMAFLKLPIIALREIGKSLYLVLCSLFVLLLFLIPVVNVVAPLLWLVFSCWVLAVQYVDYPMDNEEKSFAEMRRFVRTNLGTSLGFGAACLVMVGIPVVNFLAMPAAVAGATALWVERNPQRR